MTASKKTRRAPVRYISVAQLKRKGACAHYIDLLTALVGSKGRIRVTKEAAYAFAIPLNWWWATTARGSES